MLQTADVDRDVAKQSTCRQSWSPRGRGLGFEACQSCPRPQRSSPCRWLRWPWLHVCLQLN